MQAKTLDDVYMNFRNIPLNKNNFDEFFQNMDKTRGPEEPVSNIMRRIKRNAEGSLKILLAGHRGSGKNTELLRLQREMETSFIILNFSVLEVLDTQNLNYIELFIATMVELFGFISENEQKLSISQTLIENITRWTKTEEIEEVRKKHIDLETGAGAGISFLKDFFLKFRSAAGASVSFKKTLKEKIEPKLSSLILNCNLLINEIKLQASKINKKGLILIIEDLDKVDLERGEDIFFTHAPQLIKLNCHCIFTYPIALYFNIKFNAIKNNFTEAFVLPMIKVFNKNLSNHDQGIKSMKELVQRRMVPGLFEKKEILEKMIRKTGGCLWDLFRMIIDAADFALNYGRDKISDQDFERAFQRLTNDYNATIAENPEKKISVEAYYETLVDVALDEKKTPRESDAILDLRHNLTVLSYYNGRYWSDVHPIVRDILEFREMIIEKKKGDRIVYVRGKTED